MPYKFQLEKWHLPKQFNRRVKLMPTDKEKIKTMWATGKMSINGLARLYNVNKRLIQFILFPDREQRNKELRIVRGGSKRYYDKERNRVAQRDTQRYKQKIYLRLKGK